MVGRDVLLRVEKPPAQPGDVAARGRRTCASSTTAASRRCAASPSTVRAGEIVGIAGVDGNGQTELIDAITGLRKSRAARSESAAATLAHATRARDARRRLGHIPEDRQRRGLVLEFSIAENIALHDYAKPPDAKWGWLFPRRLVERAAHADPRVRRARRRAAHARRGALRRQPAEGGRRARDRARPAGADRGAADARPRRRRDRVPAPAPRRRARRGSRDPARLARAGRDPLALRPHPRASTRARSSASTRGDVTEEEIGLEMLGGAEARGMTDASEPPPVPETPEEAAADRHARRRASRCASAPAG